MMPPSLWLPTHGFSPLRPPGPHIRMCRPRGAPNCRAELVCVPPPKLLAFKPICPHQMSVIKPRVRPISSQIPNATAEIFRLFSFPQALWLSFCGG